MLDAAKISDWQESLIGWGQGVGTERLLWVVRLAVFLLCVVLLVSGLIRAVSVWRDRAADSARSVTDIAQQVPAGSVAVDAATVKSWGWYSDPAAAAALAVPVKPREQVVKTSLQLQLEGIIKADDPAESEAIIAIDNRSKRYKSGAKLPVATGVYLREIFWDRIILENNGRREELPLYTSEMYQQHRFVVPAEGGEGAEKPSSAVIDRSSDAAVTGMLGRYRQELQRDPNSVNQFLEVSPRTLDGTLQGYAIRALGRREDFRSLGLQDGDIVTHVNGVELTDMRRAMELYRGMGELEDVRVQLIRGGQVQEIIYRLPAPR